MLTRAAAVARLARKARAIEQDAFEWAMENDPTDQTAKLVYADWLDEHGNSVAAARLRWWADVSHKIDPPPGTHPTASESLSGLPAWVSQLAMIHAARATVGHLFKADETDDRRMWGGPRPDARLAAIERHALGLEYGNNRTVKSAITDLARVANQAAGKGVIVGVPYHISNAIHRLNHTDTPRSLDPSEPDDAVRFMAVGNGMSATDGGVIPEHELQQDDPRIPRILGPTTRRTTGMARAIAAAVRTAADRGLPE